MANIIREGRLEFCFDENCKVIKFDNQNFYKLYEESQPFGKGVDILAASDSFLQIIEVKDCLGHEVENRWRVKSNNIKKSTEGANKELEHSFDVEVAQKVANTLACLVGARTFSMQKETARVYDEFWKSISSMDVLKDVRRIKVILHLEGEFDSISHARSDKMIRKTIQDSLRKKLGWLKCQVIVQGKNMMISNCYSVDRI